MVRALVTGGTGFVGSHIVGALLEAGHTPRVLRRASSPLALLEGQPVEHAIGDVMNVASLEEAMRGCDWVFHVAAVADYWRTQRVKLYLVNVNGTVNVLDAARRAGVKRVVFTSSAAAIGTRKDGRPADESVTFNMPPEVFPYGHSKFLAEQEVARAVAQGQDVVTVNPSVIFGPGDLNQISGSIVVETAKGIVPVYPAGGVTVIDARDVAKAHLAAAERGRMGERYILGTLDISYKALGKLVAEIVGVYAPFVPVPAFAAPVLAAGTELLRNVGIELPINGDQVRLSARNIYFNCEKAWRELGEPEIDLRQSLEDTYHWYVEHGMIQR
ncbi:MAG TPA: NAD-dependent epimerase/dehydratase family protein [Aggregatilineales bacterium]|nr:NAD-dependent epimerase/dehydratase family protein [Aggregatilineales bacterium]